MAVDAVEATESHPKEGGLVRLNGTLVNRVDRIRLLGNGVANQTAAKAFATLSARLDKHLKI